MQLSDYERVGGVVQCMDDVTISDLPLGKTPLAARTGSEIVDQFSLTQGEPVYKFQKPVDLALPDRAGVAKRALLTGLTLINPFITASFRTRTRPHST